MTMNALAHFLLTLILSGFFLYLVAALAPGMHCQGLGSAILAVVVFTLFMGLFRPTLGAATAAVRALITLVTAALSLWLAGVLVPGFTVDGISGGPPPFRLKAS